MPGTNRGRNRSIAPRRGRWSQEEQARLRELFGLRDEAAIARELNRPISSVRKMAAKLFPPRNKVGPWTAREVEELKKYLGLSSLQTIALILGRSVEQVDERIIELGRIQRDGSWDREEVAEFKRFYGTRTDDDLSRIFGRTVAAIRKKAASLALAKDKAFLRKLRGEAATRMPRWSQEELEFLKNRYPLEANLEIAKALNRTVKAVVSKAHNMGLRKSRVRLRQMGRENVSLRYLE